MALPQRQIEKDGYSEDEYFDFESTSLGRWEYVGGVIRAMSGGSDDHNTIAVNVAATLRSVLLPKGSRVYGADMKIHTGDGVNTFPDVAVVCGKRVYHQGRTDVITNPSLIVEVLSDSTEAYDRGEKFDHYRTIPALTDYLLVEQDKARITHYSRSDDDWEMRIHVSPESVVELGALGVSLALADVYAAIDFG